MRQLKITRGKITDRDDNSVDQYLREIAREELISPQEEVVLAQRIKHGDLVALEKLTKANLRFVVSVAKQYQNQGLALPDLINEGNIGLIKAAQRFDETKGFKFISYAVRWIRQGILQALADHSRIVRLPLNRIINSGKITRATNVIEQREHRDATIDELAEALDVHPQVVEHDIKVSQRSVSLHAPVTPNDEGTLEDHLTYQEGGDTPDSELVIEGLKLEIERALSTIRTRESEIIHFYFGLNGMKPHTLDEIADRFDMNRETVRQIKDRAIKRLRKSSRSKQLKQYLG